MILSTVDNHGRRSLIIKQVETPSQDWIALQQIKPRTSGRWYCCYPLEGGAVIINTDDMVGVRPATGHEVEMAFANANGFAKEELIDRLTR